MTKETLTIGGKTYLTTREQRDEIDRYRKEACDEIDAAGEADFPPNVIGCAPDRFKPILKKYRERVEELLSR